MRNFKCYAHSLNDCSEKISAEHVISKSILGAGMTVKHRDIIRKVSKNSFTVKILCEHHNNQLSKWEGQMKDLLVWASDDAKRYSEIKSSSTIPENREFHMRGEVLEKWLLKTSINYYCSIHGKNRKHFKYDWICKRLFKNIPFDFPFGLSHFHIEEQLTNSYPGEIYLEYLFDENDIYGININLQGHVFFICLPTDNVHLIPQVGIPFNGQKYYPRFSKENKQSSGEPLLIWHSGGIRTYQLNANNEKVVRSTIHFEWN